MSADQPELALASLAVDGPAGGWPRVVMAHGAGAGMDSPFMRSLAGHLAAAGCRVHRFDFPYMIRARAEARRRPPDREVVLLRTWRTVVRHLGPEGLIIGGKSMGGRMASMIAEEMGVAGLVCLGYPFHPPGRPEKPRVAHLGAIQVPTLILQGDRDPFGKPEEVAAYHLSPAVTLAWLPDGDHGFKPRKASGHSEAGHIAEAARRIVAFARDPS